MQNSWNTNLNTSLINAKKSISSRIINFWANLFWTEKNEKISRLVANNVFWWELDLSWEFGISWKDLIYILDNSDSINKLILWNIKITKENAKILLQLAEKWIIIQTMEDTVTVDAEAVKHIRRTNFFDKFENSVINPQTINKKENKLDIKKLISNVLERWIISKDNFFLETLVDNTSINLKIYELLKDAKAPINSQYNSTLSFEIASLNNEELAQIRELFAEVFTIISDNSEKIWDIKNIRLSPEEANEIRDMEANREAFEIAKTNKETFAEEESKKEKELLAKVKARKDITEHSFATNFGNKLSEKVLQIQELIITIEKKVEDKETEQSTLENQIEENQYIIDTNNQKDIEWDIDQTIEDKVNEQESIKEKKEDLVNINIDQIEKLEKSIENLSKKWSAEERREASRKTREAKREIEKLKGANKEIEVEIDTAKKEIENIRNNKDKILQETKEKLEETNEWIKNKNKELNEELIKVIKSIEDLEKEAEKQQRFADFIDWDLLDAIYEAEAWDEEEQKKENIDKIWKKLFSEANFSNIEKQELWLILIELADGTQQTMNELLAQEEDENGNTSQEERHLFEAKESARIDKEKEEKIIWDLNWVYNNRKHEELKIKLEDDANDASNKVKLISKILSKEAAKEWSTLKGKFDNFTEIVKKLWLDITSKVSHKQNVNTPNFGNMVADIENPSLQSESRIKNFLYWLYNASAWITTWIWVWVTAAQSAIWLSPYEITDSSSGITMLLWLLWWWIWYNYKNKTANKHTSEITKKWLFNKNKWVLWSIRNFIFDKWILKPFIISTLLISSDVWWAWTLLYWKEKKNQKIWEISAKQKVYDLATAKFNKFLQTAKDKSVTDINDILKKESEWFFKTGKWKWPHRVAEYTILYWEEAIRRLAAQDPSIKWLEEWIKLAKQASPEWLWLFAPVLKHVEEAIKWWHKDIKFEWSNVKRGDIWHHWSEIWVLHIPFGEEIWSALPSTWTRIKKYAKTVWSEMGNEWKSAESIVKEYNIAWSKIKTALSNIWSQIQLTLVDETSTNKELAERIKKWDEIVKELEWIEAYMNIVSIRNFLKENQWTKAATYKMLLMLLILWMFHATWPIIYAFATRNKKRDYEKQIMALWWPEWVKRVEELNIALMPALLLTPTWRASLSEYSDDYISQFIYGSIQNWSITNPKNLVENDRISDKQITNVKNAIINRWGEFLEQITPEEWKKINKEIWSAKICQWLPSEFYNDYMYDQNVANQVTTIFIGKLMQKSETFRKVFRSSDILGK